MSPKSSREIGRRVVSKKVLGSANPVARWGRSSKNTCMDSIGGFFFGLLLFFVTFALPYCAATTEKDSKDMAKLDQVNAAEAAGLDGKYAVKGILSAGNEVEAPVGDVDKPILAYRYLVERYEPHIETRQETRTEVQNGMDVEITEEVEEEVWEWETLESDEDWAQFKLGTITIDPQKCKIGELKWQQVYKDEYEDYDTGYKIRETCEVMYANVSVILAAEFAGGQVVDKPDFYRITTGSMDDMVAKAHGEEEGQRWMLIVLSVILWTISMNLILGPAMILINIIPIKEISGAVRGVLTFVSLIIACLITFVTYVAIRYWWVIVLALLALTAFVIYSVNKNRSAEPDIDEEELFEAVPEDEPTD